MTSEQYYAIIIGLISALVVLVIVLVFSTHEYTLWCIDKEGIEIAYQFYGTSKNEIRAVEKCRELMFEPVDYWVVE